MISPVQHKVCVVNTMKVTSLLNYKIFIILASMYNITAKCKVEHSYIQLNFANTFVEDFGNYLKLKQAISVN